VRVAAVRVRFDVVEASAKRDVDDWDHGTLRSNDCGRIDYDLEAILSHSAVVFVTNIVPKCDTSLGRLILDAVLRRWRGRVSISNGLSPWHIGAVRLGVCCLNRENTAIARI